MPSEGPTEFELLNEKININTLPIYTRSQLALYNGVDNPKIYVAIRGYIYDVSNNTKNYGPGKGYHKLVGKDVSRLLGLNRLQLKVPDQKEQVSLSSPPQGLEFTTWYTEDLNEKQNSIIDKWCIFFRKRYEIVGIVVDHEQS
ncbi:hypothetical protein CAAN1_03S03796 [[Candida] anglica]|uniref:Cytochrome b5 heme-binding domain-containing protein n=1 Tax=[Candida] anglica TaxID=148631 RepID=A0ABP0EL89_9ASCO